MMMFSRVVGAGHPVVLLHGLFGSGHNWLTLAGKMRGLEVHLPDLRNHGQSFWADEFSHQALAGDVIRYVEERNLAPCVLAGHSLGGKVAMQVALSRPDLCLGMICLDMAPRTYEPQYTQLFHAITQLDLYAVGSRAEARAKLEPDFPDPATLAFLLKSLVSRENGPPHWEWRLNLASLAAHYPEIWKRLDEAPPYSGPAFFLTGGDSDYFRPRDLDDTLDLFPEAQVTAIPGAGHWLHADQPARVLAELHRWFTDTLEWELPSWT